MSEIYYICKDCSKCHMTKVIKRFPITSECTTMNMDKEFCKSSNTPLTKYCLRCVRYTERCTNGYCWYCNNCNTYLIECLHGTNIISYNTNEIMKNGGRFPFCKRCHDLWLNYGVKISCYDDSLQIYTFVISF